MTVLAYMIVIICTWIYANYIGYVYFSAGEPNPYVKYIEWAFALLGIISVGKIIKEELDAI